MTNIVYTTEACPACGMLKDFLKSKNVEFETKIIGKDITAIEFFEKTKAKSVPVMDINGELIFGLDLEKISSLLKI